MRITKIIATLMMLCFSISLISAQMDCPTLVRAVLEIVDTACDVTERDQVCYGNNSLTIVPHGTVSDFTFEQSGDLLSLSAVQSVQLSPFSLSDQVWGMAVMNVQANLSASLPDQNVTYLVFGDVEIDNIGTAIQIEARIVAANSINVRRTPSTQGSLVTTLDPGTVLTINGRNTAGDWLRIQLDDGIEGWIAAFLIQTDADLTTLNIVDNETPNYTPMQAFYLQTGIDDAACTEAPNSGLLIQTPEGTGDIQLRVNDVDIRLTGTAFLQAEAGNGLFINILEGSGTVSALDKSELILAGAVGFIPIDENRLVSEAPANPTPYNPEDLQSLPLALLPRQIEIIEPLLQREINRLIACRISSTVAGTNFRGGPATAYFATGTLAANNLYRVNGKTTGRDGFIWWRVANERWVRADVVTTSGNCDDVIVFEDRLPQPSTTGVSTNLTCTSERVVYAKVGDTIPITDSYVSSEVPVGALISTIFVGGNLILEGAGEASGGGIIWNTTWVATSGIHNVEVVHTATIQVKPDWAQNPFEPGESWSHVVCQIRVE